MSGERRDVLTPSVAHASVADAMRPRLVSCSANDPAAKVARMMASQQVHCIFVMHEGQGDSHDTYVWGIISDLDLMRAVLSGEHVETAGAIAQEPMITVKPDMPLTEATALMVKHQVTHLVVVDSETLRPTGVLSTTDVAQVFAWGEA